jgi:hypothetical protein
MAQFFGTMKGSFQKEITRTGSKRSGLRATLASWSGAVQVQLNHKTISGKPQIEYIVKLTPWNGKGTKATVARGIMGRHNKWNGLNLSIEESTVIFNTMNELGFMRKLTPDEESVRTVLKKAIEENLEFRQQKGKLFKKTWAEHGAEDMAPEKRRGRLSAPKTD